MTLLRPVCGRGYGRANKFFEYLASNRPILAIGPEDGDAAYILKDTAAGEIFDYAEVEKLKNHLCLMPAGNHF